MLTLPCSRVDSLQVVTAWCGTIRIVLPLTQPFLRAPPRLQRASLARCLRPLALLATHQPAALCSLAPAAMVRRYSGPIIGPETSAGQTRVVLPSSVGSARALFRWALFRAGRLGDRSFAVVALGSAMKIGSHRSGRCWAHDVRCSAQSSA